MRAICSPCGATHSPIAMVSSTSGMAVFITEPAICRRVKPEACITTSSLRVASWPRPSSAPSSAAIGKKISMSFGTLSRVYMPALSAVYSPWPTLRS